MLLSSLPLEDSENHILVSDFELTTLGPSINRIVHAVSLRDWFILCCILSSRFTSAAAYVPISFLSQAD